MNTSLTIIGASAVSKDMLLKILGPTAEYMGEGLKAFTEKSVNNINHIFNLAVKKLGPRIDESGIVPPKILKGILTEGAFCDDELTAHYFAGVLASSKSSNQRDDRGAVIISLLSRMSTYQIRSHYIFYHVIKNIYNGENLNFCLAQDRHKAKSFISFDTYATGMEFLDSKETETIHHAIYGLAKENLIGDMFTYGPINLSSKGVPKTEKTVHGIAFYPTLLGSELFYHAYGLKDMRLEEFLSKDLEFELDPSIILTDGYSSYEKLQSEK